MKSVVRRGYHLRDKRKQAERIIAYYSLFGHRLTLREIATHFGLTHGRISQILKAAKARGDNGQKA